MKTLVFGFAVLVLLFGCIDLGGGNQQNNTNTTSANVTPQQNVSDGTIIIGQQQNQTVEQNYTKPPPSPPEQAEGLNYTLEPDANFAVYFIYVGDLTNKLHGDAILIRKGDMEVLVDAGPAQSGTKVAEFLQSRGVDDIEVLISTNADPRHYGGIDTVRSKYSVEELWWSGNAFNDQDYISTISSLNSSVKKTRVVGRGFNMTINGMNFTVLNPKAMPFENVNNDAIVLRIDDRNFSMVLLSGVQRGAQDEMLNTIKNELKCDVMQAPYYGLGAGTSGIANFLSSLKPGTIVVSGGPDESAQSGGSREPFRKLMQQYNITYYENYIGGTVRVSSDGSYYSAGYFTS